MNNLNKIYWKDLVNLLRQNKNPENITIDFNNELIPAKDVSVLNRFGYRVPEKLVFYNDEDIDFSDDADITEDDLSSGKINWNFKTEIQLKPEISEWIKNERIDMKVLVSTLIENFYQSVKLLKNNPTI